MATISSVAPTDALAYGYMSPIPAADASTRDRTTESDPRNHGAPVETHGSGSSAASEARDVRPGASPADQAFKRWQERFLPADRSTPDGLKNLEEERRLKRLGLEPCTTCANRMYQDGSNDPGVSFKAPGHIAPEASFAVVSAHEQEHVTHERAKAHGENREVVSQSVQIFTSVCPECGRVYCSGGVTRTSTISRPEGPKELDMVA